MLQLFKTPLGTSALFLNKTRITVSDASPENVIKVKSMAEKIAQAAGFSLEVVELKTQPQTWESLVA